VYMKMQARRKQICVLAPGLLVTDRILCLVFIVKIVGGKLIYVCCTDCAANWRVQPTVTRRIEQQK
jgi:hypothetical protein